MATMKRPAPAAIRPSVLVLELSGGMACAATGGGGRTEACGGTTVVFVGCCVGAAGGGIGATFVSEIGTDGAGVTAGGTGAAGRLGLSCRVGAGVTGAGITGAVCCRGGVVVVVGFVSVWVPMTMSGCAEGGGGRGDVWTGAGAAGGGGNGGNCGRETDSAELIVHPT